MIKLHLAVLISAGIVVNSCAKSIPQEQDSIASRAILIELTENWSGTVDCVDPNLYGDEQWNYEIQADETDWFLHKTGTVVEPDASRELYAAIQSARTTLPSQIVGKRPDWIAGDLPTGTQPPSCNEVIAFSVPKISGDWAFVEEFRTCCGGMAKSGQIVAFRRDGGQWIEYATLPIFMS